MLEALLLQSGYNTALVAVGAALLGAAAGVSGAFLFLRQRALVSDAVAHATLPGVAIAFMAMAAAGLDGRDLAGLLLGSALTATLGLLTVQWIVSRTRLAEDAAIGAVLSVFFGFGVVLLTVVQTLPVGRQAGLEGFLLGATAGMLFQDALLIAIGGGAAAAAAWAFRRPMSMVAFDAAHAATLGVNVRQVDLGMMALVTAVVVVGLKIVGLVLIVALLIIPAAAARLWTDRVDVLLWTAAGIGAAAGYVGAAISAAAPSAPAGPVIVLVAAALFAASLLFAPARGVAATLARRRRFQRLVHLRQGLLAIARGEPVLEPFTLTVLRRAGFVRRDGVVTQSGRARAAKAAWDEERWRMARAMFGPGGDRSPAPAAGRGAFDGLSPIEAVLTPDEIAEVDRRLRRGLAPADQA